MIGPEILKSFLARYRHKTRLSSFKGKNKVVPGWACSACEWRIDIFLATINPNTKRQLILLVSSAFSPVILSLDNSTEKRRRTALSPIRRRIQIVVEPGI